MFGQTEKAILTTADAPGRRFDVSSSGLSKDRATFSYRSTQGRLLLGLARNLRLSRAQSLTSSFQWLHRCHRSIASKSPAPLVIKAPAEPGMLTLDDGVGPPLTPVACNLLPCCKRTMCWSPACFHPFSISARSSSLYQS